MFTPQMPGGAWNDPPVVRDAPKVYTLDVVSLINCLTG